MRKYKKVLSAELYGKMAEMFFPDWYSTDAGEMCYIEFNKTDSIYLNIMSKWCEENMIGVCYLDTKSNFAHFEKFKDALKFKVVWKPNNTRFYSID